MSQTIQKVCDNCGAVLEDKNYSSWTGSIDRNKYELDLCDKCVNSKIELKKVAIPYRNSHRRTTFARSTTNLEDFIEMWNNDLSVDEIANRTGLQTGSIYYKAYLARKAGFDVKKRPRGRKAPIHKPSSNGHGARRTQRAKVAA